CVVRVTRDGLRISVRDREDDDLLLAALAGEERTPTRSVRHVRATAETSVRVRLGLDGAGRVRVGTGAGLYDHLLEQLAFHGGLDLVVDGSGDWENGAHHTAEDTAIALGEALDRALGAYGAGNVRSVQLAFQRLGAEAEVAEEPGAVLDADLAVLPGVGSAGSAMIGLRDRRLDVALRERAAARRPILGICLGLQLALDESEEDGGIAGLGLVPGRAVRLRGGRVPRIGWAELDRGGETYWFAHSYAAETPATTAT